MPHTERWRRDATRNTVSQAAMRVVQLLAGRPPQRMAELVKATGVTRTAVTEPLNELISAGYVDRALERGGRGRPRHLYSLTETALSRLFATNDRLVGPALLSAIRAIGGDKLTREVLERVIGELSQHYRDVLSARSPAKRLEQLAEVLREEGVLAEVCRHDGKLALSERSCPFVDLVDDSRAVCEIEQQALSQVIGAPMNLVECRLDGCARCVFQMG